MKPLPTKSWLLLSKSDLSERAVLLQIATPWQAAVSVVQSFPRTTDLLAAVDALALEEGEPPGTVFQAAAEACDIQELPGMAYGCCSIKSPLWL